MIAERESKNDRSCIDFRENGYSSVSGELPCFIRILILARFDNQITRKVSILSFFFFIAPLCFHIEDSLVGTAWKYKDLVHSRLTDFNEIEIQMLVVRYQPITFVEPPWHSS